MLLFLPDASNVHHHMMPRLVAVVELELVFVSFLIESRMFPGILERIFTIGPDSGSHFDLPLS